MTVLSILIATFVGVLFFIEYKRITTSARQKREIRELKNTLRAYTENLEDADAVIATKTAEIRKLRKDADAVIDAKTAEIRKLRTATNELNRTRQRLKHALNDLSRANKLLRKFRSTYVRRVEKEKKRIEVKYLKQHGTLLDIAYGDTDKS